VETKDREVLEARLKEAAVVCQAGGASALTAWVNNQPEQVRNNMFVRLVNVVDGFVHIISAPRTGWPSRTCLVGKGCFRPATSASPKNAERDYTVGSVELPGGWVLQIGRTTTAARRSWSRFAGASSSLAP